MIELTKRRNVLNKSCFIFIAALSTNLNILALKNKLWIYLKYLINVLVKRYQYGRLLNLTLVFNK